MLPNTIFDNKSLKRMAAVALALFVFAQVVLACGPLPEPQTELQPEDPASSIATPLPVGETPTPLPTRLPFSPGELVDYIAQTGDTLPALAVRFNTSEAEIRNANPILPEQVTTMPPGMPMRIPIYYKPLWGTPFQIIPDALFVYGPAEIGFDPVEFASAQNGWLKDAEGFSANRTLRGGQMLTHLAQTFSISTRLFLALIEYQTGAVTQAGITGMDNPSPLGFNDPRSVGLYRELVLAANTLNNGFYSWRNGTLTEFMLDDGRLFRPDPWQNAATVALQYYFAQVLPAADFERAIESQGFIQTYTTLFGDPWQNVQPHIPGSLQQPPMLLPFPPGSPWAYTGGPHTGYGAGEPFAALDFSPPAVVGGCMPTDQMATAVADGVLINRKQMAIAIIDLDGDGDERTGWVVFYLHLAGDSIPPTGTVLKAGDPIGLPSCEGGRSTGTHVHIARKYNGEWILAGGPLAFNLEGWIAANGARAYDGTLTRFGRTVRANVNSDSASHITASGQIQD
ncbi:MAG TPA: LysM peptidoglycan-binding domain-containing protein [Levilinea sp.]|nr:LysM peptidoglycan-binding domain-containing protein [Levilinea sp.]